MSFNSIWPFKKTFDMTSPTAEVFRFLRTTDLSFMYSPRLVLPWRERLQKEDAESTQKRKKHMSNLHQSIKNLAIRVYEQKEKADDVRRSTVLARMHDICENGRNHFRTKARLHTTAEMAINPADRELYAKLYSKVDEKIWNIAETRSWYDNIWDSADQQQTRCMSSFSSGLILPAHRVHNPDRQRPTRAHTARHSQGHRYLQVSTHFKDAWSKESL